MPPAIATNSSSGAADAAQPRLAVREQAAERHALAHGLGVLHLVAQDELVQDGVDAEAGGRVEHALAHLVEVREPRRRG